MSTTVTRAAPSASSASRILAPAMLAVLGSLILTISAKVTVPMWPVPMTLQTLAVFAIAAAYGRNLGLATVALYLAQGAAGLPVFTGTPAHGVGLAYMVGPTGGYLLGFLVIAALVGHAADRGLTASIPRLAAVMLLAEGATLALGAGWLSVLLGVDKGLAAGIGPFIATDLLKLGIAAGLAPILARLVFALRRG